MQVTVYTLPNCVQCETTKRFLNRKDVAFTEVNLQDDIEAHQMVQDLGYAAAPVVIAGDNHWSGFRLDRLQGIAYDVHKVDHAAERAKKAVTAAA